jgi:hypothetical protein
MSGRREKERRVEVWTCIPRLNPFFIRIFVISCQEMRAEQPCFPLSSVTLIMMFDIDM